MRREFPRKVMVAAFERANGSCEGCGARLTVGKFAYDHINPDALTGEPTLANCQVLCTVCHKAKSADDIRNIRRAQRREAIHLGAKKRTSFRGWRRMDGTPVRNPRLP